VGRIADGLTVADRAIERCERTSEGWLFPELLRLKGELLLVGVVADDIKAGRLIDLLPDWSPKSGSPV